MELIASLVSELVCRRGMFEGDTDRETGTFLLGASNAGSFPWQELKKKSY